MLDMKKRTAFIGAILSLIPLGQPLIIKNGVVLSTTGLIFFHAEKALANSEPMTKASNLSTISPPTNFLFASGDISTG